MLICEPKNVKINDKIQTSHPRFCQLSLAGVTFCWSSACERPILSRSISSPRSQLTHTSQVMDKSREVIQTPTVTRGLLKILTQHTRAVFTLSERPLKLQAGEPALQPPGEQRKCILVHLPSVNEVD